MPVFIDPMQMNIHNQGNGWAVTTLADSLAIGTPAMAARLWRIEAGICGPEITHGKVEQLLYVVKGSGTAIVDGVLFELEPESVLWMEPGEHYQFMAGASGLEILQGYAPAE